MKNPLDKILDIYTRIDKAGMTNWPLLAAALSFYTALSVVPILAICFALAKSLGLEEAMTSALSENFSGQEDILTMLTQFAENLIRNFSGSLLVFSSLAFIFWSVHGLLWQLEINFSRIFGYLSNRAALHRASDYLTIMLVIPFFMVAAGSINIVLASLDSSPLAVIAHFRTQPLTTALMSISPALIWWMVLSWTYAYFSRGIIRWKERLIGGFITGLVFQLFQKFYLKTIISLTSYNAIYGSFAVVPLFMVWLYISWLIVMSGGEFTRRLADYFNSGLKFNSILPPLSWADLRALSIKVMNLIVDTYSSKTENRPTGILLMAKTLKVPIPHLGRSVNCLQAAGLIYRIAAIDNDEGPAFLPAIAPENLTPEIIINCIENQTQV